MTRLIAVAACALALATTTAHARPHHKSLHVSPQTIVCNRFGCSDHPTTTITERHHVSGDSTVIGGRPSGCPHAYCGCGLARYLGLHDARLNLALNWSKLFPHESVPRPGLAAVRKGGGHVMYIEASVGNGQWLIRDYNSGGGLSRLHVRDVTGYVFVNPHTSRYAMQ